MKKLKINIFHQLVGDKPFRYLHTVESWATVIAFLQIPNNYQVSIMKPPRGLEGIDAMILIAEKTPRMGAVAVMRQLQFPAALAPIN